MRYFEFKDVKKLRKVSFSRHTLASFFVIVSFLMVYAHGAYAQFEGSFKVEQLVYTPDGHSQKAGSANIFVTPQRIRIAGLHGSKMPSQLGGMKANSILIRLDMKDFVIFGQNREAVQIKKSEIVSMMSMFDSMTSQFESKDQDTTNHRKVIKTKQHKRIDGFPCQKIIVIDNEGGQVTKSEVWVTHKYAINWGMLAKPWGDENSEISPFLSPSWLRDGSMPIYAVIYQNGIKKTALRVFDVHKKSISNTMMKIPPGYQLLSWRQLLLHNMFGR